MSDSNADFSSDGLFEDNTLDVAGRFFSLYDDDFRLIDRSERLDIAARLKHGSPITLWDVYPELKRASLKHKLNAVIRDGHPQYITLERSGKEPCDLLIFRATGGLAILESKSSAYAGKHLKSDGAERALLLHQATHDALTGLPNRRQFGNQLRMALPARNEDRIALMQLDLDDFKPVNDTLGHGAGDIVLQMASERIKSTLEDGETVYRLAGDEFAILQLRSNQPENAERLASSLVSAFKSPFTVDGITLFVGASIGIAIAPKDGNESEQLMKAADVALYAAKKDGRGRARTFDPTMLVVLEQREVLRRSLRMALEQQQFFIEYQPLVSPAFEVSGFEALLRWNHPILGVIPPAAFIPMAEADGLMSEIGQWTLAEACRQALKWPKRCRVAVNLSPAEFLIPGLTDRISQTLDAVGLPADRLELEITETVLLERTTNNLDTLNTLNVLGIQISLDDFGTEYSSLSYLKNFPFDTIKIDKYFIKDLVTDPKSQTIVRFVIALAHGLGMHVTAEGVETAAQAAWLRSESCDRLQGYFLSPPLPVDQLPEFIRQNMLPRA